MFWKKSVFFFVFILFVMILTATGCTNTEKNEVKEPTKKEEPAEKTKFEIKQAVQQRIDHIYGIGYPGNDNGLYMASQDGIKIFKNNEWLEATSLKHEYMGFQAIIDGFIASGHPEKGSSLKDPLGVIKSIDKGATLKKLAFSGVSNFYFLAAGYHTNSIYIINQQENSEIKPGVYISQDSGSTWDQVKLKGLEADTLGMIAAHPSNPNIMAMSTKSGIFLSNDKGKNMKKITDEIMSTAAVFSKDHLYYAYALNNKIFLNKMNVETMKHEQIQIPFLNYDNPITFIAVNHKDPNTLSFATYLNDVYESKDVGQNWNLVLKNGRIQ